MADPVTLAAYIVSTLKKMKKELPILCGHPERGEEISHADPEMFIMMIDRSRLVWLDL